MGVPQLAPNIAWAFAVGLKDVAKARICEQPHNSSRPQLSEQLSTGLKLAHAERAAKCKCGARNKRNVACAANLRKKHAQGRRERPNLANRIGSAPAVVLLVWSN